MSDTTGIEWTDSTWSPLTGCSRVSPGCGAANEGGCYAERLAATRLRNHPRYKGLAVLNERGQARWTREVRFHPDQLDVPLRWRAPRRIFVCNQSDLFHEHVTNEQIAAVYGVMAACPTHTFQVLTKRPERMRRWFWWIGQRVDVIVRRVPGDGQVARYHLCETVGAAEEMLHRRIAPGDLEDRIPGTWPLANVHIGVSVEDRKYGVPRIDVLRDTPAAVRFLSVEPLLEDLGKLDLRGIDQVIVGGESGRGARPMHDDWVRSIRDQAKAQGCAFFYKQRLDERGRKVSLPLLDGKQWAEMPEPRP